MYTAMRLFIDKETGMPLSGEFRRFIYSAYKKENRTFPWRENTDPWGILVSEIMLQQTQTERVVSYWKRWMEKWPGAADLERAPFAEVLSEWSGLGYNRRARYLKESAAMIVRNFAGSVPDSPGALMKLPGIGPYTAGAIACFAYNKPTVFIETNIRSVMIHFFFSGREGINDREILPVIEETLDRKNPRKWYWALMDVGAALKKSNANPNRRSAAYTRQSVFSGSLRQIRGSLVRALVSGGKATAEELRERMDITAGKEDFYKALEALKKESIVAEEEGSYSISG